MAGELDLVANAGHAIELRHDQPAHGADVPPRDIVKLDAEHLLQLVHPREAVHDDGPVGLRRGALRLARRLLVDRTDEGAPPYSSITTAM